MSLQETVKSNPIYKETQILKLEDLVLQNHCLFCLSSRAAKKPINNF